MIRFAQIFKNQEGEWWLQISKYYDLKSVKVEWQDNPHLGDVCLTPEIDIQDALILCENQGHAMMLLAEHYKNELEK